MAQIRHGRFATQLAMPPPLLWHPGHADLAAEQLEQNDHVVGHAPIEAETAGEHTFKNTNFVAIEAAATLGE